MASGETPADERLDMGKHADPPPRMDSLQWALNQVTHAEARREIENVLNARNKRIESAEAKLVAIDQALHPGSYHYDEYDSLD